MNNTSDVTTAKDWQRVRLIKYRELLDYFNKKIPMSKFTGFSEKSFFQGKFEIWANSMDTVMLSL